MNIHPNYEFAKNKAYSILEENSIIAPAVSPIELAENYGLKVQFVTFKNKSISGFLKLKTNEIYVNGEESFNRNMFTIAHELGHYFLHRDYLEKAPEKHNVQKLFLRPLL